MYNVNETLFGARVAMNNKYYYTALQLYKSIVTDCPQSVEAGIFIDLLENKDCSIENYSQRLSNIKRTLSKYNIAALENSLISKDEKQLVSFNIAQVTIACADSIYSVLNDTFKMLVATRSTFQRLSPVGFSNNIYKPTIKELGKTLCELADVFEREFGDNSHTASHNLRIMGTAYKDIK